VTVTADQIEELRAVCQEAKALADGPLELIHLTGLRIIVDGQEFVVAEALLCLSSHEGYLTRLFLSEQPRKNLNWSLITVLGRTWHKWSWQGVSGNQAPAQILAQHLKAFR